MPNHQPIFVKNFKKAINIFFNLGSVISIIQKHDNYILHFFSSHIESFSFQNHTIQLFVPDKEAVKIWYEENLEVDFPYWTKIWEASIALCEFIALHPEMFSNKKVIELAAGLGLPSLLMATFATEVLSSDYVEAPLDYVQQSAIKNKISNLSTKMMDWNFFGDEAIDADIVLMSDVNYHPESFEVLYHCFQKILQQQKTILLSTPQRLMAKPFIERILPYVQQQEVFNIDGKDINVYIVGA